MLILLVVIGAIVAAVLVWPKADCEASAGSCSASPQTTRAETILNEIKTGEAALIDVREPDEYAVGHAPSSILFPLGDIEAGKFELMDKDKKLYLYCRSGNRAGIAEDALQRQGYTNVENLGGLSDWQSLGGELVTN
ncbi:hypothetical protein B7Y94_01250 [Candidatus Saccharibacteria bacterium 32-49-12]|nr:MAG: hypothetical protein B7Y94_01250 [Candidatus Saccharibacteria bacterium 32-49-12]